MRRFGPEETVGHQGPEGGQNFTLWFKLKVRAVIATLFTDGRVLPVLMNI